LPGAGGQLPRSLAGAEVRRSGRSTARLRALRVGVSGARVWGGFGVEDEVQGVRGSHLKAGPGISACGPGARAHRRFRTAGARGGGKKERRGEALTGEAREPEREVRRHGSGWPMEAIWAADGSGARPMEAGRDRCGPSEGNRPQGKGKKGAAGGLLADFSFPFK
jgi:hypothetical protein